jgi:hypothetical protein
MARFPHEFTMKKYNLLEADLNEDANDALQDFEKHLSHLTDLQSKAGDAWSMTVDQQKKLNRLSRAVCMEVEYMVEDHTVEDVPKENIPKENTPKKEEKNDDSKRPSSSPFNIFDF